MIFRLENFVLNRPSEELCLHFVRRRFSSISGAWIFDFSSATVFQ